MLLRLNGLILKAQELTKKLTMHEKNFICLTVSVSILLIFCTTLQYLQFFFFTVDYSEIYLQSYNNNNTA